MIVSSSYSYDLRMCVVIVFVVAFAVNGLFYEKLRSPENAVLIIPHDACVIYRHERILL